MGKKGKKTRWRRLPIGGSDEEAGLTAPPATDLHRNITFNEDEYTKITTPRQDVLFKKGYLGRKRAAANPSPCDTQEIHSNDSVEGEAYISEEPLFVYPPPTGYMDPTGLYYGNACEVYDPYTGTVVTMVVGPPAHCPGAPVLAALPCQPLPLQPLEWAPPAPGPWCYSYNRKKRYSTDSQNCSAQSSESTGPPGSPQEQVEEACATPLYPSQYVYPGYMFGPPVYTMNGVTVQGMVPQPVPMTPELSSKRRKKRRRRRRGGVTDDGSESSCCEEACMPGDSSDAGSKGNSDSGIHTDPTPSPPLADDEADCVCRPHEQVSTAEDDITPNFCPTAPDLSPQECSSSPSFTKDFIPNENDTTTHNVLMTQEAVVDCQEINRVSNSCPLSQDTVIYPDKDQVCSRLKLTQEADVLCKNEGRVGSNYPLVQETVAICESKDQVIANFHLTQEIVVVSQDENLAEACPKLVPLNPVIPDPLLSDNSSDDLETTYEESNEVTESIKKNTEEIHINNSGEEAAPDESQTAQCRPLEFTETVVIVNYKNEDHDVCPTEREVTERITEPELVATASKDIEASTSVDTDSRFVVSDDNVAPVPPPRRKRSMCRAAERLASRVVEEAIREGVEEAAHSRLSSPLSITEAVTRWLNSHESSPLTCRFPDTESEDEEGIEAMEEMETTGQKNVQGNPLPVPSHNGVGQRVAKDCESVTSEWDFGRARDMCDPTRSVDKYYRLGADGGEGDRMSPSVYKTAMHIRHNGPFPCGVCCIIQ